MKYTVTKPMNKVKTLLESLINYRSKPKNINFNSINLGFIEKNISNHAFATSKRIRKTEREPAIIIHGVSQRTGTVYVGELLRLHPDIYAYPNEVWEVPFLKFIGNIIDFQSSFLNCYPYNKDKIGKYDFLPLFGASFIDYLYSLVPAGKRMLLKVPSVDYLNCFFSVFPYENLLVLMRDGRDVVSSHIKTWPERKFLDVCQEWNHSTKTALDFERSYKNNMHGYLIVKYENILNDPFKFIERACQSFSLNSEVFPFEKIDSMPVRGSSVLKNGDKPTWNPIARPKAFKPTGRWENWSKKQKKDFKRIAGQTLIDAGYHENFDW